MKCAVCGKEFEPKRVNQKYCSYTCRRYANHHGGKDHIGIECVLPAQPVIRQFYCLKCGNIVYVTDQEDCRTKFCSQQCEKRYWKHSKRVRPRTVYREFRCRTCGTLVVVEKPLDRRTIFCSSACCIRWFSRNQKKSNIKLREKRKLIT